MTTPTKERAVTRERSRRPRWFAYSENRVTTQKGMTLETFSTMDDARLAVNLLNRVIRRQALETAGDLDFTLVNFGTEADPEWKLCTTEGNPMPASFIEIALWLTLIKTQNELASLANEAR